MSCVFSSLDIGAGTFKEWMDCQRRLEAAHGGRGVVDREIDQAQAGEGAEMAWLQGEGALDVQDRGPGPPIT